MELIAATQAKTDAENAAAAAAAEAATTSRRLENALPRAERELKAMEEAMLQELTSSEVKLMESTEEAEGRAADQLDKIRRELLVERERANLAMNEAKVQEARAASAEAEKETALAWQTGPDGEATGGADPAEVEELRRKIEELELTLAEVMTHGTESTVGDRARRVNSCSTCKRCRRRFVRGESSKLCRRRCSPNRRCCENRRRRRNFT